VAATDLLAGSWGMNQVSMADDNEPDPEVFAVFAETAENGSVHGDSVLVVYKTSMLIPAQPHPLAGGMQDLNNVPGSELEAPAEYPGNSGNATGRNAARNYRVKITPAPYSRTQALRQPLTALLSLRLATAALEGTWAELGGKALYHPSDQHKRMVLLVPPEPAQNLFEPGDQVEITVAESVKGPHGKKLKAGKNKARELAS